MNQEDAQRILTEAERFTDLGMPVLAVRKRKPVRAWKSAGADPGHLNLDLLSRDLRREGVTGYGVITGRFLVIDCDDDDAIAWAADLLPPTLTVATHHGRHYYLDAEDQRYERNSVGKVHPHLDVRAYGALAFGPGSRHYDKHTTEPSGSVYRVIRHLPIAPVPAELHHLLQTLETEATATLSFCREGVEEGGVAFSSVSAPSGRVTRQAWRWLEDVSDGRDGRLARVLDSLVDSGLSDRQIHLVIDRAPLGKKVHEKVRAGDRDYLRRKIDRARIYVESSPPERLTPDLWRSYIRAAQLPAGLRKTLDAVALLAEQRDATSLTVSVRELAILASTTSSTASRHLAKAVRAGWIRRNHRLSAAGRVSTLNSVSDHATSYSLRIPDRRADRADGTVLTDTGDDSWRRGLLGSAYRTYVELASGTDPLTVAVIAERIRVTPRSVLDHLHRLEAAGVAEQAGHRRWHLTSDHDLRVQTASRGTRHEGRRERDRVIHRLQRILHRARDIDAVGERAKQSEVTVEADRLDNFPIIGRIIITFGPSIHFLGSDVIQRLEIVLGRRETVYIRFHRAHFRKLISQADLNRNGG